MATLTSQFLSYSSKNSRLANARLAAKPEDALGVRVLSPVVNVMEQVHSGGRMAGNVIVSVGIVYGPFRVRQLVQVHLGLKPI